MKTNGWIITRSISSLLLSLLVVHANDARAQITGHFEGFWSFDKGDAAQGGADVSGVGNHGYFIAQGNLSGGHYAEGVEELALRVPYLDVYGDGTEADVLYQPLTVENGVPNDRSFAVSFWFRMITDDSFFESDYATDAETGNKITPDYIFRSDCDDEESPLKFSDLICASSSYNNEAVLLISGDVSDTGNGVKMAIEADGSLTAEIKMSVEGETVSASLATPLYSATGNIQADSEYSAWHHVALSYKIKRQAEMAQMVVTVALMLDGVIKAKSRQLVTDSNADNSSEVTRFGLSTGRGEGPGFYGLIDEVRLYDRELSSYEVTCLSQHGVNCVKNLYDTTFEGLRGPQGISVITSTLVEKSEDCVDVDNEPLENCSAGDWLAELRDPKTQRRWKRSIANIKGDKGAPGLAGRSLVGARIEDRRLKVDVQFGRGMCMDRSAGSSCQSVCDLDLCQLTWDVGLAKGNPLNVPAETGTSVTGLYLADYSSTQKVLKTTVFDPNTNTISEQTVAIIAVPEDGATASCDTSQMQGYEGWSVQSASWHPAAGNNGGTLRMRLHDPATNLTTTVDKVFAKGAKGENSQPILVEQPGGKTCPEVADIRGSDGISVSDIEWDKGELTVTRTGGKDTFTVIPSGKLGGYAGVDGVSHNQSDVRVLSGLTTGTPSTPSGYSCLKLFGNAFLGSTKRRYMYVCKK